MQTDEYRGAPFARIPRAHVSRETVDEANGCSLTVTSGPDLISDAGSFEAACKLAKVEPTNLTEEGHRISELCAAAGLELTQPVGFTFTVGGPKAVPGIVLAFAVPASERLRSILRDYTESAVDYQLESA